MSKDPFNAALAEASELARQYHFLEAVRLLKKLQIPDSLKDSDLYAAYLLNLGVGLAECNNLAMAFQFLKEAEACYAKSNDRDGLTRVLFNLGNVLRYASAFSESTAYFERAAAVAQTAGLRELAARAMVSAAPMQEDKEARDTLRRADENRPAEGWSDLELEWSRAILLATLAEPGSGREISADHVRRAVVLGEQIGSRFAGIARRALAEIMLRAGEVLQAENELEQAERSFDNLSGTLVNRNKRIIARLKALNQPLRRARTDSTTGESRSQATFLLTSKPPLQAGEPAITGFSEFEKDLHQSFARQRKQYRNGPSSDLGTETRSDQPLDSKQKKIEELTRVMYAKVPEGETKEDTLRTFEKLKKLNIKVCSISVLSDRGFYTFILPGAVAKVLLDPTDPFSWERLQEEWSTRPFCRERMLAIANRISEEAIVLKSRGDVLKSCHFYLFALYVSLRYRHHQGLDAVTFNLYKLLLDLGFNYVHPSLDASLAMTPEMAMESGDTPFPRTHFQSVETAEALWKQIRKLVFDEVEKLPSSFAHLWQSFDVEDKSRERLHLLCALRRLEWLLVLKDSLYPQSLSIERPGGGILGPAAPDATFRRLLLMDICELADQLELPQVAYRNLCEELSLVQLSELLAYFQLPMKLSEQATQAFGKHSDDSVQYGEQNGLNILMTLERDYASSLGRMISDIALASSTLAMQHLETLRCLAICGGSPYGYEASYAISKVLVRVQRRVLTFLNSNTHRDVAIRMTEQVLSRSLTDWMGSTHVHLRHEGLATADSFNGVRSATLEEVRAAAIRLRGTILYYVELMHSYRVWVVPPNGKIHTFEFDRVQPALVRWFLILSGANTEQFGPSDLEKADSWRDVLCALTQVLLPDALRQIVSPFPRLIIVPDGALRDLPFGALVWEEAQCLVDKFDILYLPSVTALLLAESENEWREEKREMQLPSLVVGGVSYRDQYEIQRGALKKFYSFEQLKFADSEVREVAALLGVEPVTRGDGTVERIENHFHPKDKSMARQFVPILHFSTHALHDEAFDDSAFLALADRLLTAQEIRQRPGGLRTGLVVLACCQSAAGTHHPDSLLSLANAFLIAGACCVCSSLWLVDDEAACRLMSVFYRELASGKDICQAMTMAQRSIKNEPSWEHPFFWGAFLILGDPTNPLQSKRV